MRYGLQLVPDNQAFPTDVGVGIQLQDEAAPVEIPDCPDCPDCPAACSPTFVEWIGTGSYSHTVTEGVCGAVQGIYRAFKGSVGTVIPWSTRDLTGVGFSTGIACPGTSGSPNGVFLYLYAIMDRCGHKTRAVLGSNTAHGQIANITENDLYNESTGTYDVGAAFLGIGYGIVGQTHEPIQVKLQINANDDGTTWTDIGPTIEIRNY